MPASTLKRCLPFSGELFIYFIFWQVELCHSYWGALWASHRKSKQVTIFMLSESIQNMPSCCLNVKEKCAKLFRKNTLCSASNRFWLHVLGAFLKISSEECYTLVLFFFAQVRLASSLCSYLNEQSCPSMRHFNPVELYIPSTHSSRQRLPGVERLGKWIATTDNALFKDNNTGKFRYTGKKNAWYQALTLS